MQKRTSINYQEYKSLKKLKSDAASENTSQQMVLLEELNRAEEEAEHYEKLYIEMKIINQSIIDAIKRVFSLEIGEELQKIMSGQHSIYKRLKDQQGMDQISKELTVTFEKMMKSYGSRQSFNDNSKDPSFFSSEKSPLRMLTPQKLKFEKERSMMQSSIKIPVSPFLNKSICENRIHKPADSGDLSTKRSHTPSKNVATQLFCEICQRILPPNEFMSHVQNCKYELDQLDQNILSTERSQYSKLQSNYNKMMKNLLKIRQEIEQQINLISMSKEQFDRETLKKKLQNDLIKVIQVINEKQAEIRKKKSKNSTNKSLKMKKLNGTNKNK